MWITVVVTEHFCDDIGPFGTEEEAIQMGEEWLETCERDDPGCTDTGEVYYELEEV